MRVQPVAKTKGEPASVASRLESAEYLPRIPAYQRLSPTSSLVRSEKITKTSASVFLNTGDAGRRGEIVLLAAGSLIEGHVLNQRPLSTISMRRIVNCESR